MDLLVLGMNCVNRLVCEKDKAQISFLQRGRMLCYFVIIDVVELIVNKCSMRHAWITQLFHIFVSVLPKWVFVPFGVVCFFWSISLLLG